MEAKSWVAIAGIVIALGAVAVATLSYLDGNGSSSGISASSSGNDSPVVVGDGNDLSTGN